MKAQSLKSNMIWNSVGSLYYSVCQWLITVAVARLASTYEAAGVLSVAMSVSNVFSQIGLFRIRSYQVSDIHEEVSSRQYVGFRLITIAISLVITFVYAYVTCSASMLPAVLIYMLFRMSDVFTDVLYGIDQQHERMDHCGKSLMLRASLFLSAFIAGLVLFDSLEVALVAMVLTTYPVLVIDYKIASRYADPRPSFDVAVAKRLFVSCLPAVVGMALCSIVVTYARQYLGACYGEEALGVYATVCTPIVLVQACATYVYAPLLGSFARKYDARDKAGLVRLILTVVAAMFGLFLLCALGFLLLGSWFLGIVFGPKIAGYGYLIYAGLFCSAFTAVVAFLSDLLISLRDMVGCFLGNFVGCLVSFPASWVLIPAVGLNGASYAIILSFFAASIVLGARLARLIRKS